MEAFLFFQYHWDGNTAQNQVAVKDLKLEEVGNGMLAVSLLHSHQVRFKLKLVTQLQTAGPNMRNCGQPILSSVK